MFEDTEAFSGYSINDAKQARKFYGEVLGMKVSDVPGMEEFGMLQLHIKNRHNILLYQKDDHTPATFTVLSFLVDNIDQTIEELNAKGVEMIQYNNPDMPQDAKGVARGLDENQGPDIAWFADPAGNNLAVMQESK